MTFCFAPMMIYQKKSPLRKFPCARKTKRETITGTTSVSFHIRYYPKLQIYNKQQINELMKNKNIKYIPYINQCVICVSCDGVTRRTFW